MASLNLDSILAKVDYWKESDKGRKRMKKTLDNYVRNNVGKTQAGSPVLTRKAINDYGNKLIQANVIPKPSHLKRILKHICKRTCIHTHQMLG